MTDHNEIRLWLSALGPVVAAIGLFFIFAQLRVATLSYKLSALAAERTAVQANDQQRWKKAEFLANLVKDFFADNNIKQVIYILDWHIRRTNLSGGSPLIVIAVHDGDLAKELENPKIEREEPLVILNIAESLRVHGADDRFNELEALVRDKFDWFLFRLGQFQHMISSGLFSYDEVDIHLSYELDLISNGLGPGHVSPKLTAALMLYIEKYDFPAVAALIKARTLKRSP